MARYPSTWPVAAVCDWLEYIGLGQYRKRVVHHCVTGELLLRLSSGQLKVSGSPKVYTWVLFSGLCQWFLTHPLSCLRG